MSVVAAPAAPLMHPLSEVVANSVDGVVPEGVVPEGVVPEGVVPCDGTAFKIVARRAGARGVIGAERTLSTGDLVHGRRMDHVLTSLRGAR